MKNILALRWLDESKQLNYESVCGIYSGVSNIPFKLTINPVAVMNCVVMLRFEYMRGKYWLLFPNTRYIKTVRADNPILSDDNAWLSNYNQSS